MDAGAPRTTWIALAPVVLALLFDLAAGAPPPAPSPGGVAAAVADRFQPLALAVGAVLTAAAERPAIVLLHALSAGLVFAVLRLSLGSDRAALFAAALWAVAPAHRRATGGGDGLAITVAAALALASLALALLGPAPPVGLGGALRRGAPGASREPRHRGRRRPGPGPVPRCRTRSRSPRWRRRACLLGGRGPRAGPGGPEGWLGGLGRAFDDVLPVGPGAGLAILALAAAAAVARGPWLRRSSVWCGALFLYALPWTVILGEQAVPAPGSSLLATLPLAALAAEGWLRARTMTAVAGGPRRARSGGHRRLRRPRPRADAPSGRAGAAQVRPRPADEGITDEISARRFAARVRRARGTASMKGTLSQVERERTAIVRFALMLVIACLAIVTGITTLKPGGARRHHPGADRHVAVRLPLRDRQGAHAAAAAPRSCSTSWSTRSATSSASRST